MKIHNKRIVKYAVIETSCGDFRVWKQEEGFSFQQWKEDIGDWGYFDELKLSDEDILAIKKAAEEALK